MAFNPLLVVALPLLGWWAAGSFMRAVCRNQSAFSLPQPAAAVALGVIVAYWILRNLPWWPCTLLAPVG